MRVEVRGTSEKRLLNESPHIRDHKWPAVYPSVVDCEEVVEEYGAVGGDDGQTVRVSLIGGHIESV